MDPNETMRLLRNAIKRSCDADVKRDREAETDALLEIREHVENLDRWITRGGFLPQVWTTVEAEYLVRWEITVSATSALDAAQRARAIQVRRDSTAVVFEASPLDSNGNPTGFVEVDLDE